MGGFCAKEQPIDKGDVNIGKSDQVVSQFYSGALLNKEEGRWYVTATEPRFKFCELSDDRILELEDIITTVEREKGRPAYACELFQEHVARVQPEDPTLSGPFRNELFALFKPDMVLADAEMNQYSMNPDLLKKDSPFELCSDRIARMFPEYEV